VGGKMIDWGTIIHVCHFHFFPTFQKSFTHPPPLVEVIFENIHPCFRTVKQQKIKKPTFKFFFRWVFLGVIFLAGFFYPNPAFKAAVCN